MTPKTKSDVMRSISGCPGGTGNNGPVLSDNARHKPLRILNNAPHIAIVRRMRHILLSPLLGLLLGLSAHAASAACYADYKAKQDAPLRLHYGVMELRGDCSRSAARDEIADRLRRNGWILLNVVSVFDESGLDKRKSSAGQYFLRF